MARYDRQCRSATCLGCANPDGESPGEPDPGIAGASARREFERRTERRETRVKDRFGRRLGGVLLALTDEPQSTRAWEQGARGEREVAAALEKVSGASLLHDRRIPGSRANIDHIAVTAAGIFVVDAKRYKGEVRVRDVGRPFRRDERLFVGRRDCSALAFKMQAQVAAVVRAAELGGVISPPVAPVLCFVGADWPLLSRPKAFPGVRLESPNSLQRLLVGTEPTEPIDVEAVTRRLTAALPPA